MTSAAHSIDIHSFDLVTAGQPLERRQRAVDPNTLSSRDVLIRVAGCGICHTDLGFIYGACAPGSRCRSHSVTKFQESWSRRARRHSPGLGSPSWCPRSVPCGSCTQCKRVAVRSAANRYSLDQMLPAVLQPMSWFLRRGSVLWMKVSLTHRTAACGLGGFGRCGVNSVPSRDPCPRSSW